MKIDKNNNIIIQANKPQQKELGQTAVQSKPVTSQQTQLCSSEASLATGTNAKIFFKINEKPLDIAKAKADFVTIVQFCKQDPQLKAFVEDVNATMEEANDFLETFKAQKFVPDLDPSKRIPLLKKFSAFAADAANKEIIEKIGEQLFADIVLSTKDTLSSISPKALDNFKAILRNPDFAKIAEKLNEEKLSEFFFNPIQDSIVERNIALVADALKNDKFLQKAGDISPSLLLYNGDMKKLLTLLKQNVESLKPDETLKFDTDYITGETRIHKERNLNGGLVLRKTDFYDKNLNANGLLTSVEGVSSKGIKTLNTRFKDFEKNFEYHSKELYDETEKKWYLNRRVTIQRDSNGKAIQTEITKPSSMEGVMNVKTIDANGKIHTKVSTEKTARDTRVVKNLVSPDGTVTKVRYILSNDNTHEAFGYQVSDKDGNILAEKTDYKTRINENITKENINGHHYTIRTTADEIRVLDESTLKVTVLDMKKLAPKNSKEFLNYLKNLSAPELEAINKFVESFEKAEFNNSSYGLFEKIIKTDLNTFCTEHELGHAKDSTAKEHIAELLSLDKSKNYHKISSDPILWQIYREEKQKYDATYPMHIRRKTHYFTGNVALKGDFCERLRETIAEANALTQEIRIPKWISERSMQIQENFAKTIAYLLKHKL